MFPPRLGHNVGKQSARAQSEQGDRDRQKREMVIEDHRKDARERQLQDQGRKRGERHAQIELRPFGLAGFSGRTNARQYLMLKDRAGLHRRKPATRAAHQTLDYSGAWRPILLPCSFRRSDGAARLRGVRPYAVALSTSWPREAPAHPDCPPWRAAAAPTKSPANRITMEPTI